MMTTPLLGVDLGQIASAIGHEFTLFSLDELYKAFFTLFVTIDIIGAIPIILSLKAKGKTYHSAQVGIYSGIILIAFLLVGEPLLGSFGADISTFGVAGGIVLFVMAVEMIFGIEIFKSEDDSSGNTTFVPLVFPLFAGAASFTTLLTLRSAGIAMINLALSIVLNMVLVYLVLRYVLRGCPSGDLGEVHHKESDRSHRHGTAWGGRSRTIVITILPAQVGRPHRRHACILGRGCTHIVSIKAM